jgi:hypothetical protein
MSSSLSIDVGVVVVRERIDDPWQPFVWRPDSVMLHPPETSGWRELRRDGETVAYLAGRLAIELHRKETASYIANLESGAPSVLVVVRDLEQGGDPPVEIAVASVSPFEMQAYGGVSGERVVALAMPRAIGELVEAFVREHHVEERFLKRQRARQPAAEEHNFGQEPIVAVRERMRRLKKGGGGDGGQR